MSKADCADGGFRPMRRWHRPLTALAGIGILAAMLAAGPGAPTAQAAPAPAAAPTLSVTIASVTPTVITQSGDITITGQVTNLTDQPIANARISMWTAGQTLTTVSALQSSLADPPTGSRITQDPRATQTFGDDGDGTLAAGASADFTVTAATSGSGTLRITRKQAAYLIGVQVLGRTGTRATTVLAQTDAVISYADPSTPSPWAQIVRLTDSPALLTPATDSTPAVFADDHLAADLVGRLSTQLAAALQPGATVLIDPELWDEVSAMAQGYDVRGSDGTLTPGTGTDAATSWLAAAQALLQRPSTYRTLYGDPDIAAAAAAGRTDVLTQTDRPLPDGHPLGGLPLAVLPRDGQCSDQLSAYLAPAAPSLVLCRNETSDTTRTVSSGQPVLGLTTPVDASASMVGWTGALQGLFDAETLLRAQAGQPVAVLVDGPSPSAELPSSLTAAGDLPAGTSASQFSAANPAIAPSQDLLTATSTAEHDLLLAGQLSGTDAAAAEQVTRVVGGLWSTAWAPDDGGRSAALAWASQIVSPVSAQVDQGSLQLTIAGEVHLSSANNVMPVTIVNTYGLTVQVAVEFHSDNSQRLAIPTTDIISVAPGESALVRVPPQASGNGTVSITATLISVSGQPVGAPVSFLVVTSSRGMLGSIIIIAAGAAFLVATALRVRRMRATGDRKKLREEAEADEDAASAPTA